MHTQNWIETKSSVSLPLKSMKKNGKEMGEAVRLNSLFGIHISRNITLLTPKALGFFLPVQHYVNSYGHFCQILAFFTMAAHQIWSCHVTQEA